MTNNFERALALATEKFQGITDNDGQPYILHCLRVALAQPDDTGQQVGVLHDIVEDTDVTLEELSRLGFAREVIEAVDALTHRQDETYQDYVLRIADGEVARRVKLADLSDNYRLDRVKYRLQHQTDDGRRLQRYVLTYQFLMDRLSQADYIAAMERL